MAEQMIMTLEMSARSIRHKLLIFNKKKNRGLARLIHLYCDVEERKIH